VSPEVIQKTGIKISSSKATANHNGNDEIISFSNISVKSIIDEINEAPPFHRDEVGKHFEGIWVKWQGSLWKVEKRTFSGEHNKNVMVEIHALPDNLHYRMLIEVNINRYPELKIAKRGSQIHVEGKIVGCSGEGMYVKVDPIAMHFI
jgi:hypothetical protein